MKPWDLILPLVLPLVPGCPDLVAEEEIRNAAEEFFERSKAWRIWSPEIATVAAQADYTPTLPTASRIVKMYAAKLDGQDLAMDDGQGSDESGPPTAAYTDDLATVTLFPKPTTAGMKLKVRLALTVTLDATGLDDALFAAYRQQIAHGAVARLCAHADKPYSNPGRAGERQTKFDGCVVTAKVAAERLYSTQPKRVRAYFM